MTAGKFVLILIVIVCVVVVLASPQVRQSIGNVFTAAKQDMGPVGPADTLGGQAKVFTAVGDPYYHVEGCPRLEGARAVATQLPKAREMAKPCPVCNPPE